MFLANHSFFSFWLACELFFVRTSNNDFDKKIRNTDIFRTNRWHFSCAIQIY